MLLATAIEATQHCSLRSSLASRRSSYPSDGLDSQKVRDSSEGSAAGPEQRSSGGCGEGGQQQRTAAMQRAAQLW